MGRWDDYDYYYKPSVPIRAKGGIKAQSKKGSFGKSWWARRWISVLEGFHIGARLDRGRSYARMGQVLSIEVGKGEVNAKVQGSRPKPYSVRIETKVLGPKNWEKVIGILSKEAIFVAKLLTGEMPEDIEEVFEKASLSLFPQSSKDLNTSCSCPDWSNPCKHIAAVYYLLGEEFDRDPFLIFKLRGIEKEELIGMLRAKEKKGEAKGIDSEVLAPREEEEPLPIEREKFWNGEAIPDDFFGEVSIPEVHGAIPKKLGSFPFWRGEGNFMDVMEEIYSNSSLIGLDIFLGGINWKVSQAKD